ncbi:MAG: serine hydrolase [Mucilaginibacter sp.]|nr:serine hydrolase [Mucilaginibacter sp.]
MFLLLLISSLTTSAQKNPQYSAVAFNQIIDSLFKAGEPGGVALIAQKGHIIYERSFGMANLELNVKMQPDMVFQIGSMTKQFTAISILQLMEQQKLALSDSISKYIPECPASWRQITIENLLTHTSGIADGVAFQDIPLADMVNLFKSKPIAFAPGTKMAYSNSGYVILGYIIEKVSGISYQDYLQKNILDPVGLTHTWYGNNSLVIPGRVPAYIKRKGLFINFPMGIIPSAAGALLSNTHDLLKWNQALIADKLVKKETLDKAWTSYHLLSGKDIAYGYGWQTGGKIQGSPVIEHGGNAGGYMTDAIYLPGEDVYVVVMMNQRGILPEIVASKLAAIALGKPDQTHPISLSDETLKTYTGVYKPDDDTVSRYITLNYHKLYYQKAGGGPRMEMKPYAADQFFFDNTSVIGQIKRDEQKHITYLLLYNNRHLSEASNKLLKTDTPLPLN